MRTDGALSGHAAPLQDAAAKTGPEALRRAAKEMESLFAYELLKSMKVSAGLSGGALGGDTYVTLFQMELSKILAEQGLGLEEMFTKGLHAIEERSGGGPGAPLPPARPAPGSDLADTVLSGEGRVSSPFGLRKDPITGALKMHRGLDLAAPSSTGILPLLPGTVTYSGEQPGYGNVVIIDHGGGLVTKYAHNEANRVKKGDTVGPDTVIALVGSRGRSTGPHLHLEVLKDGVPVDPRTVAAVREG